MNSVDPNRLNPLLRDAHARQVSELMDAFPALRTAEVPQFLSLWKYLDACPQRFLSADVYKTYLNSLLQLYASRKEELLRLLQDQRAHLDNAYRHADDICGQDWHDAEIPSQDDYGQLIFIDQELHPAYLRLTEAVFRPLLHIPAHFSRLDRGKGTEGLDLHQIVQELTSSDFDHILDPYDHLMRNGIAHGGITYSSDLIQYQDKKGNRKQLDTYGIIRRFDNLLDVSNGLLLAFSIFMFTRDDERYELPANLLVDELRAATKTPYWSVVGCLPVLHANKSQLVVHVRPDTLDRQKVQFSLFHSAIMLERLAPGYERYFFSFRSKKCWPGFAAFDGRKLATLRESESPLEAYGDVLVDNLLFFDPRLPLPRLLAMLGSLWLSYKIHRPLVSDDVRQKLGWPQLIVRSSAIHRNGWGIVLDARVVIGREVRDLDQDLIRRNCARIVRKSARIVRAELSVFNICKYLPLGFCRIHVYRKDHRTRRLSNFGLANDLVCTIQVQRIRRIRSPDIFGSTIEIKGRYRIAWNRNWLEDSLKQPQESSNPSRPAPSRPGASSH